MGKFSIRRHKQNLSDSATAVTVDPSMSPSQRSLYGSIISSRTRNRLHRLHHSSDETNDPPNDIMKRPQRKLVKKSRQQQRSESTPDERTSETPSKQKPHAASLPTTLNHSMGRGYSQNWSDNDIRPPRGRVPYALRGSVGSSADILLTPIRGSTAISDDDFVLLPSSHVVETGNPDDIAPQSERCESPEPTIETVFTESEAHHTVAYEPHTIGDTALVEPSPGPPSPGPETEPDSEPEPEDPTTPLSHSFTSETRTIVNTIAEVHPPNITQTPVMPLDPQTEEITKKSPVDDVVAPPVPNRAPKVAKPVAIPPHLPVKPPVPVTELQRNIIPFPSDSNIEVARHRDTIPTRAEAVTSTISLEPYQNTGVAWVVSAWQTASGIMLLAAECFRWLARKGLRDDFRSCMSYWFLRELVIGFVLPLFLAPVALWLLFRTIYLHHESSSISS